MFKKYFKSGVWRLASGVFLISLASVFAAGGGADYGRGPETDPIATPILTTATGDVASLKGATGVLNTAVTSLQGATGVLNSATGVLNSATGSLNTAVTSLQGATGVLNSATGVLNSATGSLNTAVTSLQGATGVLNSATGVLNSATGSLNTAVTALNGATGVLNGATGSLDTAVTALNGATGVLNGATGSLNTAVSALNGATGVLNGATGSLDTAVTALNGATGALNNATNYLNANIWGAPGISTSTVGAVATAAIQTKTLAGGNLAAYRVIHIWLSDTSMGAAGTNNVSNVALSGGTAVSTVTANCDYWYLTAAAGTASAAITGVAVIDKYIMVADGASVTAAKITFEP